MIGMCVIIVKPAGIPAPDDATFRAAFRANPDGAGMMYADGDDVHVRKGLMTVDAFLATVHAVRDADALPFVYHFRIGTQGGNTPQMCHPFPVTPDDDLLRAPSVRCRVAIAHNGILSLTARHGADASDTYLFVRDYATLFVRGVTWHEDARTVTLLERLTAGSRVAVLSGDGHVEMAGTWTKGNDGCWYSNELFRNPPRVTFADDDAYRYDWWRARRDNGRRDDGRLFADTGSGSGVCNAGRKGKRHTVPGASRGGTQLRPRTQVEVLTFMPSGLHVYNPDDETFDPVTPSSRYVAGRDGSVWMLHEDGARRVPGAEFWADNCDLWVPGRGLQHGWERVDVLNA